MWNMIHQDSFLLVFSVVVLGFFLVRWLSQRSKQRRARNWPSEPGHVQSATVVLKSGGGQPGAAAYYAELKYSYTVQGETYFGGLRRRFMLKERAEKWIDSFAKNEVLTVRYNPQKTADSVLLESDQLGTVRLSNGSNAMEKTG